MTPFHGARFYEHEAELERLFSSELATAVAQAEALLLVVPSARRAGLERSLLVQGLDLRQLEAASRVVLLDARGLGLELLAGERLTSARLADSLLPALKRASAGGARAVRVMVEASALIGPAPPAESLHDLELSWEALGPAGARSVTCVYALADFAGGSGAARLREVCAAHDSVVPAGDEQHAAPLQRLLELQREVLALRAELREISARRPLPDPAMLSDDVSGARVLIVEDDRSLAEQMQELLLELDYVVVGCSDNVEGALRIFESNRPDLVLIDVGLSGEADGVDLARELRRRWQPGPALVFVTARDDEATLRRVRATDSHGYLLKPFRLRHVESVIKLALGNQRREQRLLAMERFYAASNHESSQRLFADLHDQVGQPLVGVSILAGLLKAELADAQRDSMERIEQLVKIATGRLATILREGIHLQSEQATLVVLLERLCLQSRSLFGVQIDLEVEPGLDETNGFRANELCLVAQEAVTNAVRHGGAVHVRIELRRAGARLLLEVQDDGRRRSTTASGPGVGIKMMEYRSRLCGGTLSVEIDSVRGALVQCSWFSS
jgi:signal transduction histidine kinase